MGDLITLRVGGVYVGLGPRRAITQISGNLVEYAEENSLSYLPLIVTRKEFEAWVKREELPKR
jgi:hypothetical protein